MTQGNDTQGTRLTFLRLEEAVLAQLGQQRTAGTGGLKVAQGNVRRVESIRQMGKACRERETEEGNMFQPWNKPHRSTDCCGCQSLVRQAARTHAATHTVHGLQWGALPRDPASGMDPTAHPSAHPLHCCRGLCLQPVGSKWSVLLSELSLKSAS